MAAGGGGHVQSRRSRGWRLLGGAGSSEVESSKFETARRARQSAGQGTFTGCWSPNGKLFASAGGGLTVYDTASWRVVQRLPHDGHVLTGCFSRDSKTFSTGRGHNKVRRAGDASARARGRGEEG